MGIVEFNFIELGYDPIYTHKSSKTAAQNGMAAKDQRILHNTFILRARHLIHFEVSMGRAMNERETVGEF